jgi:manganese/zinc/iron transport system permease protein
MARKNIVILASIAVFVLLWIFVFDEILKIASVVAIACALPGVFLVLRKMSLMSDAISHSVLPGIVMGFLLAVVFETNAWNLPESLANFFSNAFAGGLNSPLLIIGAVLMGLLTVYFTELINRTKLVSEEAAIGLVFPALFSIGVIMVTRFTGDVHLDNDAVFLGALEFAAWDRLMLFGLDLGPVSLYTMGGILLVNVSMLMLFFKELKLTAFDAGLAASMGFAPWLLHYGLMFSVSLTSVGAFDSVGAVLVVALMIAPAAGAWLLNDDLVNMILTAVSLAVLSAILGYGAALALDVSIAGAIAAINGVLFLIVLLSAPRRGLIARQIMKDKRRWDFACTLLTVHLSQHAESRESSDECNIEHLTRHINWTQSFADQVVKRVLKQELAEIHTDNTLSLTSSGKLRAKQAMEF